MSDLFKLQKSPRSAKKWRVTTPSGKNIDFGATGYSDFPSHKDSARKDRYLARHSSRENWTETGTNTAGFWSRWILWNLPDFNQSIKDTEKRFGIKIVFNDNDNNSVSNDNKSNNKNLDILSNQELIKYCNDNPIYDRCNDDNFWYQRFVQYYGNKYSDLKERKPVNYTWKQYFEWVFNYDMYNSI